MYYVVMWQEIIHQSLKVRNEIPLFVTVWLFDRCPSRVRKEVVADSGIEPTKNSERHCCSERR